MTKMLVKSAMAGLLALTVGSALTLPATAGQVSFSYAPADPDEAQALGLGMQIFSLFNGMSSNGGISQNGFGNMAGVAQNGSGNHGVIIQEGDGHEGTIEQTGDNNSCGLFQFGESTDAECVQSGNNQSSATWVFGF